MFFCCRRDDFETDMAATSNVSGAFAKNQTSIPMVDFDSSPGLPVAPLQAYRAQSYQPGISVPHGKFSPVDFKYSGPPLSPAYSIDPTYPISPEDQFEDASEGSDSTESTLTDASRWSKGSKVGQSRKVHFDEASGSSKGSRPVSITVSSNSNTSFPLSAKINFIRLILLYRQLCVSKFLTSAKDDFAKFLAEYQTSRCLFSKNFENWQFLAK